MKDKDFLLWLTQRLIKVYDEDSGTDFVTKLNSIALATPADQDTPNTITTAVVHHAKS